MKYVTVEEMVRIERESHAKGHTYPEMMEHAGRGLAEVVHDEFGHLEPRRALALVGPGNNGGDALVALAYLSSWGWEINALIVTTREEDDPLVDRFHEAGGRLLDKEEVGGEQGMRQALSAADVLLDGVLGTGIHLPVRGEIAETLDLVRRALVAMEELPHIVAVDCPSGVDADSGEVDPACIPAEITVTMAAIKRGLLTFPAYAYVGELRMVEIGLPQGLEAYEAVKREVVGADWVREVFPERPLDSHKGTYGTALIIAGSVNYSGAAALASQGAYRVGTGLVTLAVPEPLHAGLVGSLPETTWLPLPHQEGFISEEAAAVVQQNLDRPDAALLGPGFGMRGTTMGFIDRLLAVDSLPPLVVDADGLKLLTQIEGWTERLPAPAVLTPHPGEMSLISGLSTAEIQGDRVGAAERFAGEWGHVIVLKGAHTVIASPAGETKIIPIATSALASAGTGDVLAGVIVGLLAGGLSPFNAASAGAWLHGQAGISAADRLGNEASVLAWDVAESLIDVIHWWDI